jgi:hypothetical protein
LRIVGELPTRVVLNAPDHAQQHGYRQDQKATTTHQLRQHSD